MNKTGVIVIEIPDPPTTENASTEVSTETQTSSESDGTSKPRKKDKAAS